MTGVEIRPRKEADLEACITLLDAVHAADGYPMYMPEDPASFLVTSDELGAWVAEDGDRLLGHVALRTRSSAAMMEMAASAAGVGPEQLGVVARLLVAPGARRQGAGRALLQAAARRAVELGRRPVLDVVRTHAAAIALYHRAGWTRVGDVQVTFTTGQTVDELVFVGPDAACG